MGHPEEIRHLGSQTCVEVGRAHMQKLLDMMMYNAVIL